jgi:hypothetical protein
MARFGRRVHPRFATLDFKKKFPSQVFWQVGMGGAPNPFYSSSLRRLGGLRLIIDSSCLRIAAIIRSHRAGFRVWWRWKSATRRSTQDT